jgi:chromosome segregation ATPase
MYNSRQFYAGDAQDILKNKGQAQEDKNKGSFRDQKLHELEQLETQLLFKKQEVQRLKTLYTRLQRDVNVKQGLEIREEQSIHGIERQLKDTETRITQLDQDVDHVFSTIGEKIAKEKALLYEHQRALDALIREKKELENKKVATKRSLTESLSRLLFYKKKEEHGVKRADEVFESSKNQLHQTEQALKAFTQETTVLENKIRVLRTAIK